MQGQADMAGDTAEKAEEAEEVEAAAVTVTLREDRVAVEATVVVVDKGSAGMRQSLEAALRLTAPSATHQAPTIQSPEEEWHNLSKIFLHKASSSRLIQTVLQALVAAFINNSRIRVQLICNQRKNSAITAPIATNSNKVSAHSIMQLRWVDPKFKIRQLTRQHKLSSSALDNNNFTLTEVLAIDSAAASATW